MELWIIKTINNKIRGPFPLEKIHELISKGELHSHDEVCKSNGYWFQLSDTKEVIEQLKVDPLSDQFLLQEDEITEISQETATLKISDDLVNEARNSGFNTSDSENIYQQYKKENEIENFRSYPLALELKERRNRLFKKLFIFSVLVCLVLGILFYFYYPLLINL